ncbi:7TM-DISM domain-containing protein [Leptothrix ochracea]|uniref:7TMR-DISMED2 domain-containing protein n=2 Tax=Leptothrix ochracea TaxID=735331 RepID=UPI0034E2A73B
MMLFLNLLALLVGMIVAQPAGAGDLITARAVLEDPSGLLTIADVVGRDFEPMSSALSKGYTASAFWLRIDVRAPAKGHEVVLRMRPTYLDEIRLFEPHGGDPRGWKTRVTGDRYPYDARDRPAVIPSFVVHVTGPQSTYYLRLVTTSTVRLDLDAMEPHEADQKDHQLDLVQEFFVLIMLWLLLWAMHDYWYSRQPEVGLFCVYQIVYILGALAIRGYLAPWIPAKAPEIASAITNVLIVGVTFMGLWLNRALLKIYALPTLLIKGLNVCLLSLPMAWLAMALDQTRWALHMNAVMLLVQWVYFMALVFSLQQVPLLNRLALQIFCGVIAFLVLPLYLSMLGWLTAIESDVWTMLVFSSMVWPTAVWAPSSSTRVRGRCVYRRAPII